MTESRKNISEIARSVLHEASPPIELHNGVWRISNRVDLLSELGEYIFDTHLDAYKDLAIKVLSENDPSLDLDPEERYSSGLYNKNFKYSRTLRKALADGVGIIGSKAKLFTHCTNQKAELTAILVVRELLKDLDWKIWASLTDHLPSLAEAAPNEFLDALENTLQESNAIDMLFSQEDDGIFGRSYISGILWALEGLAWDEKYFIRVCMILADLADRDPGGKYANRPSRSLSTILLPWHPQTYAPIEKRKIAVETINKEYPEIAWKLIIDLLPNQIRTTSGSHKPQWRIDVPEDAVTVLKKDYWEQSSFYSNLVVKIASNDSKKLAELVTYADHLPADAFGDLLKVLSSESTVSLSEEQRLGIWNKLNAFLNRHRRFSEAKWAVSNDSLEKMEQALEKLAPNSLKLSYQYLFSDRDFELYEENENWEEQRKKLDEKRRKAIKEIYDSEGLDSVVEFIDIVDSPSQVGRSFGHISDREIDNILVPGFLCTHNQKHTDFIGSYIWCKQFLNGWKWLDSFNLDGWSKNQIGAFLSFTPFSEEAWKRVDKWLAGSEQIYWKQVPVNPYAVKSDLELAAIKLTDYGRPNAAITCLDKMRHEGQEINTSICVKALMAAVGSEETATDMDSYHIEHLIEYLQNNPKTDPNDMFRVEWAYVPLLERYHSNLSPKLLEKRLAEDPEFFSEVIRLIYRSTLDEKKREEPSEEKQAIASNAWRLLFGWRRLPGTIDENAFNDSEFQKWVKKAKEICKKSGHLEVALIQIGQVLIYAPEDEDGLWIKRSIAEELNKKDNEKMRDGFRTSLFNSRGAHSVDPEGKPEKELSKKYEAQAEAVENAGYHRLAETLRQLSRSYEREAERIISEHSHMLESE